MNRIKKGFLNSLLRSFFSLGFCLLFVGAAFAEEKPIGKVIGISGTVGVTMRKKESSFFWDLLIRYMERP